MRADYRVCWVIGSFWLAFRVLGYFGTSPCPTSLPYVVRLRPRPPVCLCVRLAPALAWASPAWAYRHASAGRSTASVCEREALIVDRSFRLLNNNKARDSTRQVTRLLRFLGPGCIVKSVRAYVAQFENEAGSAIGVTFNTPSPINNRAYWTSVFIAFLNWKF